MSEQKTGIGRLLAKIGNFFEGLFNAAAKAYNSLSPGIQKAFQQGSEILRIINSNVEQAPEFVIELIQQKFPELDRDKLLSGLNEVAKGLNIASAIQAETLEDTLKNIQAYLATLKGSFWAGASAFGSKLLAFAFAPAGTKWATFESLMEYFYQSFVKKD